MAYDEHLAQTVRAALGPNAEISERKMFGGLAFMFRKKMFCGIVGSDLMVRVGPERYADCLARPHVREMDFTGKPMKGYVFVAPSGWRGTRALKRWVNQGLNFVGSMDAQTGAAPRRTPAAKVAARSRTFAETFKALKQIVSAHAADLEVQRDTPTEYILTGPMMPKWEKELWFGGVKTNKSYVSLHVMPVYMFPDLLEALSPELRARMQGKSCFNFKQIDPQMLVQVEAMIAASIERLRVEGILPAEEPTLSRPLQVMDESVRDVLTEQGLMGAYRQRPPYQRNDYLGWIYRAKRPETQAKRLAQMLDELESGDRYMKMKWAPSAIRSVSSKKKRRKR